jgi:hypothetical protein
MNFVKRNEIDLPVAQVFDQRFQKFGLDFEECVRLERLVAGRAHVMQRENRADPRRNRPENPVHAREIKCLQTRSDRGISQIHNYPRGLKATVSANLTREC